MAVVVADSDVLTSLGVNRWHVDVETMEESVAAGAIK